MAREVALVGRIIGSEEAVQVETARGMWLGFGPTALLDAVTACEVDYRAD